MMRGFDLIGNIERYPPESGGRTAARFDRLQVFPRPRNANHSGADGRCHTDLRPPFSRLRVERFQPGGTGTQRHRPHSECDARDRQFLSGSVRLSKRSRLRRRGDRTAQALGPHLQVHPQGVRVGLEGSRPLQDGSESLGVCRHRLRHEGEGLGFNRGSSARQRKTGLR